MNTPPGTVTIMFTDLVGSTALAERLGEGGAQALRRAQERILRRQFLRFNGNVIKDTGNGFMVTFASAWQAVECAVDVQREIAGQQAEGRYEELRVGIGLHTGEPAAEGGDIHGVDVDLASRIAEQAAGGQVLASESTHVLSRKRARLDFAALGDHSLKGFVEPVLLFEVRWPEQGLSRPRLSRFVGRDEDFARLRELMEGAVRGQGSLAMVAGDPGVGKTRLVTELAIYAADRGVNVLTGRAYETEGMPPYLPFTEPLSQYVRRRSPEELRAQLDGNAPHVAKLLPEIRELLPDLPEPSTMSPEDERYSLFEGVSDFLLKIASDNQLLLFLDDLHWADGGTLLLLQHLAQRLAQTPLLVVGTYRDVEVDPQHPLAGLLAEMTRQRLGSSIALQPFDRSGSALLMEAMLGQAAAPKAVEAIFAAAAGNPFFTEELVWHLVEQGRDLREPQAAVGNWEIPEGARQVIQKRLARLSEAANQMLAYSSVLGRDLSLSKVALLTGKDEDSVLDLLDEALGAHVLRAEGEGYAFAHPLIREALYQALSAPRRRQLHRRVCESLEALYAANPEPHLAELAHHFLEAARGGDPSQQVVQKAIDYARRAGERATALFAWEEAVAHYERALQVFEMHPTTDECLRIDLLLALAEARLSEGGNDGARKESALRAADIARRIGDHQRFARAVLSFAGPQRRDMVFEPQLVALIEEALVLMRGENGGLRAMLLVRLSQALYWAGDRERRRALNDEALAIARPLADRRALLSVLSKLASFGLAWEPGSTEDLPITKELLALALEVGDKSNAMVAHGALVRARLERGDRDGADAAIAAHVELERELRRPGLEMTWRAMQAALDGRLDDVELFARQGYAQLEKLNPDNARMGLSVQIWDLRRQQGRLMEEERRARKTQNPIIRAAQIGLMYAEAGRLDEARAVFEEAAAVDFAGVPFDGAWVFTMPLLADTCVLLHDAQRASILYEMLRPYQDRCAVVVLSGVPISCTGSFHRPLGGLSTAMSRWAEAECHYEAAIATNQGMRAIGWAARTRGDYAAMLVARSDPGDRAKALGLLDQALDTARELGIKALEESAADLKGVVEAVRVSAVAEADALPLKPRDALPAVDEFLGPAGGKRRRYPEGLTAREVDVLRLIASGLTNREIAAELVLSPRTVGRHITNLYAKIEARGKADATAYALRHALT